VSSDSVTKGFSRESLTSSLITESASSALSRESKKREWHFMTGKQQDAQLSQRDRAAGCVIVHAKSRRLELRDNIL